MNTSESITFSWLGYKLTKTVQNGVAQSISVIVQKMAINKHKNIQTLFGE